MSEPERPRVEVVEEVDSVPVPVSVERRLSYLARHLGMGRAEVTGRLLEMLFREELEWEDVSYVRRLADEAEAVPGESGSRTS